MIVSLFIAVPLLFYLANSKHPRDHNALDRVVVTLSAPVQWLVVAGLDAVMQQWRHYIGLVGVSKENEVLQTEVATLRRRLSDLTEAGLERERLRLLLGLKQRAPLVDAKIARVIATSPTALFRSIRIDKGTQDGLHVGAAVVTHRGVAGRVAAVAKGWADVMLIVDANSSIDVLVQRTRARARLRGYGGDHEAGIQIEYLRRTANVKPGDMLITSGLGTIFPKGLPVGYVVSIQKRAFGLYQGAMVRPSVDFRRLEEVMVIPQGWPKDTSFEQGLGIEASGQHNLHTTPLPDEPSQPPTLPANVLPTEIQR